jgi:hypothetical protein
MALSALAGWMFTMDANQGHATGGEHRPAPANVA